MDLVLMPPLIPASALAQLTQVLCVTPVCYSGPVVDPVPSIVTQNLLAALTNLTNPPSGYPIVGSTADYRNVAQLIYAGQADVVLQSFTAPNTTTATTSNSAGTTTSANIPASTANSSQTSTANVGPLQIGIGIGLGLDLGLGIRL